MQVTPQLPTWSRRAPEERLISVRFWAAALFCGGSSVVEWSPEATGRNFMYYVYVLKSLKSGRFYTGSTNNLERRLVEHNGRHKGYTKFTGPFKLLYKEEYDTRSKAYEREMFLKTGRGRELLKSLINMRA